MIENENTSVYILGSGAIGKTLCGLLADYKPELLSFSVDRSVNIKVEVSDIRSAPFEIRVEKISDEIRFSNSKKRIFFICQKAFAIPRTISFLSSHCNEKDIAIILSNGIGIYNEAKNIAPQLNIVRMAANFGARFVNEDRIALAGPPAFSGVFSDLPEIERNFIRLMFSNYTLTEEQTVRDLEWNKTCVNFLVNSLCTIVRGDNSTLFLSEFSQLTLMLFDEYQRVAKAESAKLRFKEISQIHHAVGAYKDNINSTLQDVLRGSKTEIEYLVKPVLDAANKHSIPVPASQIIYQLLIATEKVAITNTDSDENRH